MKDRYVIREELDVGQGLRPSEARGRVGPKAKRGSIPGRGLIYVDMYGMWYFGELAKLCAYGFQFMFQLLLFSKGRTRIDRSASTYVSEL